MTKHILSKSTFMYGCQCPKRLYLHKFKPELSNEEDEQQTAIFAAGTNAGVLARDLYKDGFDATPPNSYSYHIAVAQTAEQIANGQTVIYEAAFQYDGVMCAVDILVKKEDGWHAFEVKSTNSLKAQHQDDAALQHYVVSKSGLPLKEFSVVHFNRNYVRKGDIDVQQLFVATSVKDYALSQENFIASKIDALKAILANKVEPMIEPGDFCFTPYECNFTDNCWKGITVEEKPEPYFNPHVDGQFLMQFTEQLVYPLFYMDFETVMYGVPEFDSSSPYQQIPFQFSGHIVRKVGKKPEHTAYLGDGSTDPRPEFIKALIEAVPEYGSIIVYNVGFERSCIKKLAENFPDYAQALLAISERMVDLMIPFRNKSICFHAFGGSYSLKKVLPTLVPNLKYSALEIQEGGTASFVYSQLQYQEDETRALQRQQLLDYCHLDTLAMVKIMDWIYGFLEPDIIKTT